MSENMMPQHGSFCWTELMTKDSDAAKNFYTELFGWKMKKGDVEGVAYSEIVANEKAVGGLFQMGKEFGEMPSHWMSYVAVDDVDASAKRVEELGGKVCVAPTNIPNVGRFCVITDPTGANLSLITLSKPLQ